MIRIHHSRAMQYIYDHFNISGEAQRMCSSVFQVVEKASGAINPENAILELLDGIGFERSDLDKMKSQGILEYV